VEQSGVIAFEEKAASPNYLETEPAPKSDICTRENRIKYTVITVLAVLLSFVGWAKADTVYTYTGNPYSYCGGTYTCTATGPFLSITLDVIDNLTLYSSGSDIAGDLSAFSFTDGAGVSITEANASTLSVSIGTEASGNSTSWDVTAITNTAAPLFEYAASESPYPEESSQIVAHEYGTLIGLSEGDNFGPIGTWTVPRVTGLI
jgi:hypothetical protein